MNPSSGPAIVTGISLLIAIAALPLLVRSFLASFTMRGSQTKRFFTVEGLVGICVAVLLAQSAGAVDARNLSIDGAIRFAGSVPDKVAEVHRLSKKGFREATYLMQRLR